MGEFFKKIIRNPFKALGAILIFVLLFDVYFNDKKILGWYDNHQAKFMQGWLACDDYKEDKKPESEISACQTKRKAEAEEMRSGPKKSRIVYLPKIISNYFEYYF